MAKRSKDRQENRIIVVLGATFLICVSLSLFFLWKIVTVPTSPKAQNEPARALAFLFAPSRTPFWPVGPTVTATKHPRTPTPKPPFDSSAWGDLPVVATASERARNIYRKGLKNGTDPHAFSKIGDCNSTLPWYLGDYDLGKYSLGDSYANLQDTIDNFKGSFDRSSLAVRNGMSTSSILSDMWANPQQCQHKESMLDCEIRLHNPSIVIISLGSNDGVTNDVFEDRYRQIIESLIDRGILPILATKADNVEGGNTRNTIIARLAWDYDLPLWNYWKAAQKLGWGALDVDGVHLQAGSNYFDIPTNLQLAWPVRNLTALQSLDVVWKKVRKK